MDMMFLYLMENILPAIYGNLDILHNSLQVFLHYTNCALMQELVMREQW